MTETTTMEELDDDVDYLHELDETITAIESGDKRVTDKETELEGYRMLYTEQYNEVIESETIQSVELVDDPAEYPDHPVRAKTERFDIIGKFGDEKHDTVNDIVFVMVEHRETGLSHNEINGDIGKRLTEKLS